jgi:putative ABC transport system permease protein
LVIYNQLQYIRSKDVGYNKEQLLTIWNTFILGDKDKVNTFKNEVLKMPGVKSGTMSVYLPIPSARADNSFFPEGSVGTENAISMQEWKVDHNYIQTFGMKIIKGRDFNRKFATDSSAIIINEAAAKLLGYEDPIGKILSQPDFQRPENIIRFHIIGVINNFHYESLRSNISPLCLSLSPSTGAVTFNINTVQAGQAIKSMEAMWKKMAPDQPFYYDFVDESFNKVYHAEQRSGKLLAIFAGFAIFIACLGLFGLVTYAAEQRTKEIGIRKVLGASLFNVLTLLSKDFLRLVIVAFIISVPISWWAMNNWLNEFAYKIEISWWLFAFAGGVAVLIALITISFQGVKAAVANPVKSLRSE